MARPRRPIDAPRQRAEIAANAIPGAIRKLERRAEYVKQYHLAPGQLPDSGVSTLIASEVNATIDDVFGVDTLDAEDFKVSSSWFWANLINATPTQQWEAFNEGVVRANTVINAAIGRLRDRL